MVKFRIVGVDRIDCLNIILISVRGSHKDFDFKPETNTKTIKTISEGN